MARGWMCGTNAKPYKQEQMGRKPRLTWQAFVCIETEAGVFYHHSSSYLHESACSDPDLSCIAAWASSCTGEGRDRVDTCSAASLHFSLAMSSGSPCYAARPCSDQTRTETQIQPQTTVTSRLGSEQGPPAAQADQHLPCGP